MLRWLVWNHGKQSIVLQSRSNCTECLNFFDSRRIKLSVVSSRFSRLVLLYSKCRADNLDLYVYRSYFWLFFTSIIPSGPFSPFVSSGFPSPPPFAPSSSLSTDMYSLYYLPTHRFNPSFPRENGRSRSQFSFYWSDSRRLEWLWDGLWSRQEKRSAEERWNRERQGLRSSSCRRQGRQLKRSTISTFPGSVPVVGGKASLPIEYWAFVKRLCNPHVRV